MHKIAVVSSLLQKKHKDTILAHAKQYQYEVCFFSSNQEAKHALKDIEILYGQGTDLFEDVPSLKWFCSMSAGVEDYVDLPVFTSKQAILSNSSGAYGVTISEHVIMVLLQMLRRDKDYRNIVEKKQWIRNLPIRSIYNSSILILGTGDIGSTLSKRLRAFQPKSIIGMNRSGHMCGALFDKCIDSNSLEYVLPNCDILISCLPANDSTYHILNKDRLELLSSKAVVVNVGRGNTIDQQALVSLLKQNRIYGACLDVFEQEPIDPKDPIWDCGNVLITPHISGNMMLDYTIDKDVNLFLEDFDRYVLHKNLVRQVK